jgi:gliding motility-associated lipoprotein GldH
MTRGTNRYAILLLLALFLISCSGNVVFTDSVAMKGKIWKLADIPSFKVPVKDTVNSNNIYFLLRTGSTYPFRNIYLFVTTSAPDGKSITDTLQYDLADEKGNWYGKGFGDIHELRLPYKTNIYFPYSGIYKINIQHGMRIEDLSGVYDIGVRVEKNLK